MILAGKRDQAEEDRLQEMQYSRQQNLIQRALEDVRTVLTLCYLEYYFCVIFYFCCFCPILFLLFVDDISLLTTSHLSFLLL